MSSKRPPDLDAMDAQQLRAFIARYGLDPHEDDVEWTAHTRRFMSYPTVGLIAIARARLAGDKDLVERLYACLPERAQYRRWGFAVKLSIKPGKRFRKRPPKKP
jgi:hypothetical protein